MRLPVSEGFPTDIQVVDRPEASLLPAGPWVLVGDPAARSHWRACGLPEPEGSRWVEVDESSKRLATLEPWLEAWAALPLHRNACIVAVGGGVLTDLVGLAAALFLRGVDWQAWPTTLLAQVDAGLGGKTAVNLEAGKNLAGAFHPPVRMVVCRSFLDTLPERHLAAGRWELVKTALMEGDGPWAEALLASAFPSEEDLARALAIKVGIVHRDLAERGERRLLNLGHTLGHALEAASGFRLLHGEAVGLGTLAACLLAERQGLPAFPGSLRAALAEALRPLGDRLPSWEACRPWVLRDKKSAGSAGGAVHCILPCAGARAEVRCLPPDAWAPAHADLVRLLDPTRKAL